MPPRSHLPTGFYPEHVFRDLNVRLSRLAAVLEQRFGVGNFVILVSKETFDRLH